MIIVIVLEPKCTVTCFDLPFSLSLLKVIANVFWYFKPFISTYKSFNNSLTLGILIAKCVDFVILSTQDDNILFKQHDLNELLNGISIDQKFLIKLKITI